jgi:serine/threonine-protein kinase
VTRPERPTGQAFVAPSGFRDSPVGAVQPGEVVLSTFQVQHSLARTDTGEVYAGWDMLLERPVAMKIAWRDAGTPPLLPEARRCAAVRDPGAVEIYQIGTNHGLEAVVAERVEGGLLDGWAPGGASAEDVLEVFRAVVQAVAAAHDAGIAVGALSAQTIAIDPAGLRVVLGRLSMSQVPAVGPDDVCFAPEVVSGAVAATNPVAAGAIDLYALGCVAVHLATGRPLFAPAVGQILLAHHIHTIAPHLSIGRPDLPAELADLVTELLAKDPAARPASASIVRDQVDAIVARAWASRRGVRVLVIDDHPGRAAALASLARRAHPRATVLTAASGPDAVSRMRRDHPDLVLVDAGLGGEMNALELCMFADGADEGFGARMVVVGDRFDTRDRTVFAQVGVVDLLERDGALGDKVVDLVRNALEKPRPQNPRPRRVTG